MVAPRGGVSVEAHILPSRHSRKHAGRNLSTARENENTASPSRPRRKALRDELRRPTSKGGSLFDVGPEGIVAASVVVASIVATSVVATSVVVASIVAASVVVASIVAASIVVAAKISSKSVVATSVATSIVAASIVAASIVAASIVVASIVVASIVVASIVAASIVAASIVVAAKISSKSVVVAAIVVASIVVAGIVVAGIVVAAIVVASIVAAAKISSKSVVVSVVIATGIVIAAGIGRRLRSGRRTRRISRRSISSAALCKGLVNPENSPSMLLSIESIDGGIGSLRIHLDKTKAPGSTSGAIVDQIYLVDLSIRGKKPANFLFTPTERQVTYIYSLHS